MMQFKDYVYKRPDMKVVETDFDALLEKFKNSTSFEVQDGVLTEIVAIRNNVETMATLVETRHSIDTTDAFYEGENDFIDENMPIYEGLVSKFYQALVDSKYRSDLENK